MPQQPPVAAPPRKRHGAETMRDMFLTLLVIVAVVFVLVKVGEPRGSQAVKTVDSGPTIEAVERSADFDVLVPAELDRGWRTTTATFDTEGSGGASETELRLGFVTPSDGYALYVQSDLADVLDRELQERPRRVGTETVAGESWERYTIRKDETALVHRHPDATLIVTGSAPLAELRMLAGSLR